MSLHLEDQERDHLSEKINLCYRKFNRACDQMTLLDQRISDTKMRYNRAIKNRNNAFRYTLRQRLAVLSGVKMMYYEYASKMADEMDDMRQGVHGSLTAEQFREIYGVDDDADGDTEDSADAGMQSDQGSGMETDSDEEASIIQN